MKRTDLMLALAFYATIVLILTGCQSAESRFYAQRAALTSFEVAVLDAHAAGVLSDEELVAMDAGVQSARVWLSTAKSFLPDGGDTFEAYLSSAAAVLDKLSPILLKGDQ